MTARSLVGCCNSRHCIRRRQQICNVTAVVVSICFAYVLPSASSTLVFPPLKSCHLDGACPKYFYCDFNQKLCYPCSGTTSDTRPVPTCDLWPELQESDTRYPMQAHQPELAPSCNASVLEASSLMSASCSSTCSRRLGGVYCFAGTRCNVTCSLTADTWTGHCTCQLIQIRAQMSCAWSLPLPTCVSADQDTTTIAGGPASWQSTVSVSTPAETMDGQSEAAATPSEAERRATTISIFVPIGAIVSTASVVVGLFLCRRSMRLVAKDSISGGANHLIGVSTVPPGDPPDTGPPSKVQNPPTIIVNHVTNNTNIAVTSPLQHLTVSNGAVVEQALQRQWRSASGEAGKPQCCCTGVPVVATDSPTALNDDCHDGLGSDADSGCRQPLLTAVSSAPSCSRCLQAAVGMRQAQQLHLGDAGCRDVILPQAQNSGRVCYPDSATVHRCLVHDGPKMEPPPMDFVDACTHASDVSEYLEACPVEGHCEFTADADDDGGSMGTISSDPEVPDSAYCSTDGNDNGAVGVLSRVHESSIGLVTIKAACVKNCELQLAAGDSRSPSSALSTVDGGLGSGGGASNAAVRLELGCVDMLRVTASAGESRATTQPG